MVKVIALAALLVGVPGAAIAQQAVPLLLPGEALVQVNATGEVKGVPDIAVLSAAVSTDGANGKAALVANAIKADRLVRSLHAAGVPDGAIKTSDLSVRARHSTGKDGEESDAVIGYRATNRLSVRVSAADAGRIVDVLASADASEIDGPSFSFADQSGLARQARDGAVKEAQQRARDYAEAFGLKAIRVVRVSERSVDEGSASDIIVTGTRTASPILPGERSIRVTIWTDYAMNR